MSKYLGKTYLFYFIFVLLDIYLTNCLIEIPLKSIEVDEDPKHRHTKIKKPEKTSKLNKTILVDEGDIIISLNRLYLANIKIGSNEQEFNLILDTGSDALWVAQTNSYDQYPGRILHHYSPSSSSTSNNTKEPFIITYGSGAVRGYFYTDYIKYINDQSFKMRFGVANTTSLSAYADGIIGLANNYVYEDLSFIRMMKEGGVTDSILFSFKFDGQAEGKMYIGKHDDFSSKNAVSCSLINNDDGYYWIAKINGFSVKKSNTELKSSQDCEIIFDTGTNVIDLPYDYLEDIKSKLSKVDCTTYTEDNDNYQLKCNATSGSLPNFRFKINKAYLTIPYNYSFYYGGDNYFYSRIYFMKTDKTYIIGSPFFYTFHTLFDRDDGKLSFYSEDYIEKTGLSTLAIVLIVLAVIIVLAVLGIIIYIYIKKRKKNKALKEQGLLSNYT